ncbi:hypothetical protein RhiJN_05894 [Ceratobasidium sp. AG-Ba]|nr:hypothetical protein RhiJN_05894 [Ceratobasidium sp. AG-Ba]QRW06823.1 hypothetical protein RhiLY_05822 [Ceratobasidium sp. AG-Ba]
MAQLSTEELLAMLAARGVNIPTQSTTPTNLAPRIDVAAATQPTILAGSAAPAPSTAATKPMPVAQSIPPVKRARPVPRPPPSPQTELVQRASSVQPPLIAQAATATHCATSVPAATTGRSAAHNRSGDRTDPAAPVENEAAVQSAPISRSSTPVQSVTTRSTAPSRQVASSRSVRLNVASGPLAGSRPNRTSASPSATEDALDTNPQPTRRSIPVLRKLNKTESELLQRQLAQLRVGGRTIQLNFIGLKPPNLKGSHTKVSDITEALGLSDDDYGIVRKVTKYTLEHTPGIDMSQTSKKQLVDDLVDAAVDQVLMALPEFEPYRSYGNWPLKLIATKVLRNTTNGFQNRHRPKKPKPEAQESERQESEHRESEHQESEHQEPEHQEPKHASSTSNQDSHADTGAPIHSPLSQPQPQPLTKPAAMAPLTARHDEVAVLTKDVDDMSIDPARAGDNTVDSSPFSLPPELTGSARDVPPAMEVEPTPAPRSLSASHTFPTAPASPAVAEPVQVTINSTVTATATNRSVSKATSTVSAPAISTPSRAPRTPSRSETDAEMSPGVLAHIQGLRRVISASNRSRLAPSVQSIMSILDRLDAKAIPIDPQAVLALSPTKNDGSRPPPYSEPILDIDHNSDGGSELSDIPEIEGGLVTDPEDMELDDNVVANVGRKGKQRATQTAKAVKAAGEKRNAAPVKGKGKAVTPPAAAGGSGSSSSLQSQPARRSSRQVASTNVATAPPPNKPSQTRKK